MNQESRLEKLKKKKKDLFAKIEKVEVQNQNNTPQNFRRPCAKILKSQ